MTKVVTGALFGMLIVRRRLPDNRKAAVNMRKRVRVQCMCGSPEFELPDYYLTRNHGPRVDCGCSRKSNKTIHNQVYRIWYMMHERTENVDHVAYKDYGARGIRVCEEWHRDRPDGKGFDNFLAYVGPRPSPEHTIDRIDNNLGYQPYQGDGVSRQVRWATAKQQRANQRPRQDLIKNYYALPIQPKGANDDQGRGNEEDSGALPGDDLNIEESGSSSQESGS